MSVNTNLVARHKVITDPDGVHEISRVLGMASLDVGTLCRGKNNHTYINIWAKYKPVRYGLLDTITTQWNAGGSWSANTTKWRASSTKTGESMWWRAGGSCGIEMNYITGNNASIKNMCATWLQQGWRAFWKHQAPRGTEDGHYEPYRLTDFAGYIHFDSLGEDYDKPWQDWLIVGDGNVVTLWDYRNATYPQLGHSDAFGNIREANQPSIYHLNISDIRSGFQPNGYSTALADSYFGVIVAYYPQSGNPEFSLLSSPFQWSHNVTEQESRDTGMPAGTDLRWTPALKNHQFRYNNSEFYVFPILSSRQFTNDDNNTSHTSWLWEGNGTINLGSDWILPMPLMPKQVYTATPEAYGIYSMVVGSLSTTGSTNTITFRISIKNNSDHTLNLDVSQYTPFLFHIHSSDSNRETLWDSGNVKMPVYSPSTFPAQLSPNQEVTANISISHTLDRGNGNYRAGDIIQVYLHIDATADVPTNDRVDLGYPSWQEFIVR